MIDVNRGDLQRSTELQYVTDLYIHEGKIERLVIYSL